MLNDIPTGDTLAWALISTPVWVWRVAELRHGFASGNEYDKHHIVTVLKEVWSLKEVTYWRYVS